MNDLAILYEPSSYSLKGKVMGRQATGASFMQTLADARLANLGCLTDGRASAQDCADTLARLGAPQTGVTFIPYNMPERLKEFGVLYRPDPVIGPHAWHRHARANARDYSLCGVTMTLSTHAAMSALTDYLIAPVESWDAVICISSAGRDVVRNILERSAEHLRERLGARRFTLPQLPVIPLGIHTRHFTRTPEKRAAARVQLGLADDEVVVLFAGRLSVHEKAHPLPMYLALEKAAGHLGKRRKVVLIQAGKAPNAATLGIFTEEPKRFCPSVRVVMVDGGDFDLYAAAWAAADIFTSLSDNIQETFGLTPVEAMAAGLPCVVSDWNGYRESVRDGIDGFRVPSLSLPPGRGGDLADRYDMSLLDFHAYSFLTSQLVAVNVEAAVQAFVRLIDDADLRARMGATGAEKARNEFDWSVIFSRYRALWNDLAERRRADPQMSGPLTKRQRPNRLDPFQMFSSYPTDIIGPSIRFRRRDVDEIEAIGRRDITSIQPAKPVLPSPEVIASILALLGAEWMSQEEILRNYASDHFGMIDSALVWLCKVGVIDYSKLPPTHADTLRS